MAQLHVHERDAMAHLHAHERDVVAHLSPVLMVGRKHFECGDRDVRTDCVAVRAVGTYPSYGLIDLMW